MNTQDCYFSLIEKQAILLVNHTQIHSWNQPVLSNESKVSCSRKQRGPLLGLELMTDLDLVNNGSICWVQTHDWFICKSLVRTCFVNSITNHYVAFVCKD